MNRFTTKRKQLPPNGAKVSVKLSNCSPSSSSSTRSTVEGNRRSLTKGASGNSQFDGVKNHKNRLTGAANCLSQNGQVNVTTNVTGGNNVTGGVNLHRASSPSTKSSASSSCSSSCFSSTSNYSTSSSSTSSSATTTTASSVSTSSSSSSTGSKSLMYKGSSISGCGKIRSIHPPSNQSSVSLSGTGGLNASLFTSRPSPGVSSMVSGMKEGTSMSIIKETVTGAGGKKNSALRTSTAVATVTSGSTSSCSSSKCTSTVQGGGGGGGITVAKVSPLPVGKKDTSITKQPPMSIITSSTCSSCNSPPPPAPPSPVVATGANPMSTSCCNSKTCDGHSSPLANKKVIFLPQQQQQQQPSHPILVTLEVTDEEKRRESNEIEQKDLPPPPKRGEEEKSGKELSGRNHHLLLLLSGKEGCKYTATIGTNDQNEWTSKVHSQKNEGNKVESTQAWIDDGSFNSPNQPSFNPPLCKEQHQEEGCYEGKDLTMHLKVHSSESENELSPYNNEDHLSLLTVTTAPGHLGPPSPPPRSLDSVLNHDHHHHQQHHQHPHHSSLLDNGSLLPPNLKLMIESYKVRSSSKHLPPSGGLKFLPGNNHSNSNFNNHNSHIISGHILSSSSSPFFSPSVTSDAGREGIYSDSEYVSVREMSKRYQFLDENKMDLNKRNTSSTGYAGSGSKSHHISSLSVNNSTNWSFSPVSSSGPSESVLSHQDAASSREIKDLQSQVKFSKEKVSDLTSQLFANAQMMSAFEKTLSTLSMKLQQLSLVNHQKDIEISRLRAVTDVMIAYKAEQEKCSNKCHNNNKQQQQHSSSPKSNEGSELGDNSTPANSIPSSPSKRLWIKSTLNKAFLKNKILQSPSKKIHTDTQVTNSPSGTLSQTSSSSSSLSCGWSGDGDKGPVDPMGSPVHSINCKSAKSSENESSDMKKATSLATTAAAATTTTSTATTAASSVSAESLNELREKLNKADSILEKTRLEAITSAFHLENTKELVNSLKEEAMYLRRQNAQLELAVKKKQSLVHSSNHLHQEQQQKSHQQLLLC